MHELWRVLVPLDDAQVASLERYLNLLIETNRTMNLTRIVDRDQARLHHIADSLTLLKHLPPETATLADVGSGGGVPGIPLAIARPGLQVTLIESIGKKGNFLREAADGLGLSNVEVVNDRAERVKGRFDVVVCRAVAPVGKLLDWCLPLVAPGGVLLAMKGPRIAEEIAAVEGMLARQKVSVRVHPVTAPGLAGHVVAEVRMK